MTDTLHPDAKAYLAYLSGPPPEDWVRGLPEDHRRRWAGPGQFMDHIRSNRRDLLDDEANWRDTTDPADPQITELWRQDSRRAAEDFLRGYTRWVDGVPARYRTAAIDDGNDRHARVLQWWASDSLTCWLAGPVGTGKTYAATALCNRAAISRLRAGETPGIRVTTLAGLLDAVRAENGTRTGDAWEAAKTSPVLLIDDVAHTKPTDFSVECLWILADHRTSNDLRTLVTTNATLAVLRGTWGPATIDRLADGAAMVEFTGKSRRRPLW